MKYLFVILALLVSACEAKKDSVSRQKNLDIDKSITDKVSDECIIRASENMQCRLAAAMGDEIKVSLQLEALSGDEWKIKSALVSKEKNQKPVTLSGSNDILIIEGDVLIIKYRDINFDDELDLAISTSFATPNLYFDYWLSTPEQGSYLYVGNFPDFNLDTASKTLKATVKINAENYEKIEWKWNGEKIEKLSRPNN